MATNPYAAGKVKSDLNTIYAAVSRLMDEEGQDRSLVCEMSLAMMNDLIENGQLRPLVDYVTCFCDVLDSAEDAQRIADDI